MKKLGEEEKREIGSTSSYPPDHEHSMTLNLELYLLQRLKLPLNLAAMSLSILLTVASLMAAAYVLLIPFGVAFAFTLYYHRVLRRAELLLKERLLGTGHSRPRI
jgi:hypothetical protein